MISNQIGMYAAIVLALGGTLFGVSECGKKQGEADRAERAEKATKDETAKLWTCSGNLTAVRAGVDQRNAEIEAQRKAFEAKLATSEQAAVEARKSLATAQAKANRLLATPLPGADQCVRMLQADEAVVKELRQ